MRTVRQLIRALRDEDEEVRAEAADRLGELGAGAAAAIPALIDALGNEAPHVRCRAARALGLIGAGSAEAALALIEAVREDEAEIRVEAARALLAGGAGDYIVEALEALGEFPVEFAGEDHLLLLGALTDDRRDVCRAASRSLSDARILPRARPGGELPANVEAARLAGLLEDGDPLLRTVAARFLAEAGVQVEPALTALLACSLDRGPFGAAPEALRSLRELAARGGDHLPDLSWAANEDEGWRRRNALGALYRYGVPSEAAAHAVAGLLRCADRDDTVPIARALGRVRPGCEQAIGALHHAATETGDSDAERDAVLALGELGESSDRAALALIEIVACGQAWERDLAGGLLMRRIMLPGVAAARLSDETLLGLVMALADDQVDAAAEHLLRVSRALDEDALRRLSVAFGVLNSAPFRAERFDDLGAGELRLATPALAGLLRRGPASILENAARALRRVDPERARAALALGDYDTESLDEADFRAILEEGPHDTPPGLA